MDALLDGRLAVLDDEIGIAGEVADGGIDLGKSKAQLGHGASLSGPQLLGG